MATGADSTGHPARVVRVAVIDSGVHAHHPHVGGVSGGIGIDQYGDPHDDFVDRLGHGTAVTAAIREKAPAADLYCIKVFDRELAAPGRALVAACRQALAHHADLINLSLGTLNADHEAALIEVLESARQAGAIVIAAGEQDGRRWLPGSLAGAWAVSLDWNLPRDRVEIDHLTADGALFRACGYPRPIPGVPPERNLKGLSFAVANVTGVVADLLLKDETADPPASVIRRALRV